MAKTILMAGRAAGATTTANTVSYHPLGGECRVSTVEGTLALRLHTAGTLKNLAIVLETNTLSVGSMTIVGRKNSSTNLTLTLSVGTGATGLFEDTTHTDTITANDDVYLRSTPTSGETGTVQVASTKVEYDTNASTTNTITTLRNSQSNSAMNGASTTYYAAFTGGAGAAVTVEADCQWKMQYSATLRNLGAQCSGNSRTSATTVRLRKNGANGNQSVSLPITTSGTFYDTTNTDTVAANDLVCYSITNGTGTDAITHRGIQIDFQTTTNPGVGIVGICNIVPATVKYPEPATVYIPLSGMISGTSSFAVETNAQTKLYEAWTFKGLTVGISNNDVTSASTVTLRKGAADTALSASITASTTGFFQDTTDTVTIASGDLVNYVLTTPAVSGTRFLGLTSVVVYTEIAGTGGATTMDVTDTRVLANKFLTKV